MSVGEIVVIAVDGGAGSLRIPESVSGEQREEQEAGVAMELWACPGRSGEYPELPAGSGMIGRGRAKKSTRQAARINARYKYNAREVQVLYRKQTGDDGTAYRWVRQKDENAAVGRGTTAAVSAQGTQR